MHLLACLRLAQEVASRDNAEVAIFLQEPLELLEDLRVHDIRRNIRVGDVFPELRAQLGLDLLEVERLHGLSGSSVNAWLVTDDLSAQRLGEAADRLTEEALEELDDGGGEVELVCPVHNVFLGEFVRDHELCEVADDLRRRRDLDEVATLLQINHAVSSPADEKKRTALTNSFASMYFFLISSH